MKATIQLSESEIKAAICTWLLREYGISVNATNDITMKNYDEEWLGDPQCASQSYNKMRRGDFCSQRSTQEKVKDGV